MENQYNPQLSSKVKRTPSLRLSGVDTSFWRNNDVICTLEASMMKPFDNIPTSNRDLAMQGTLKRSSSWTRLFGITAP